MKEPRIDRLLFFTASTIAIAVCIPLGLIPEQAGKFISDLYSQIASNFGVFYQLFAIGTIGFLVWLASSDYGRIRLGGDALRCGPRNPDLRSQLIITSFNHWRGYEISIQFRLFEAISN